jgi:hypothetical protein
VEVSGGAAGRIVHQNVAHLVLFVVDKVLFGCWLCRVSTEVLCEMTRMKDDTAQQ